MRGSLNVPKEELRVPKCPQGGVKILRCPQGGVGGPKGGTKVPKCPTNRNLKVPEVSRGGRKVPKVG